MTPPELPGRQRVGPHVIEDYTPELTDHVEDMIQNKGRKTHAQKMQMWCETEHLINLFKGILTGIQPGTSYNESKQWDWSYQTKGMVHLLVNL